MISKYDLSLSKAVGPMDPSFLVVKKSHFNKNIHLTASLRTPQNSWQYSKTYLKQPLKKKDKTKILITNGSLMKVKRIAECSKRFCMLQVPVSSTDGSVWFKDRNQSKFICNFQIEKSKHLLLVRSKMYASNANNIQSA